MPQIKFRETTGFVGSVVTDFLDIVEQLENCGAGKMEDRNLVAAMILVAAKLDSIIHQLDEVLPK